MIKRIVLKQDDLYSTSGIVYHIYESLGYDTNRFNEVNDILADKKCVSKFFKENNIEAKKVIDRRFFYSEEDLNAVINDVSTIEHFKSRINYFNKHSSLEAYQKQAEKLGRARGAINLDYKEVGLSLNDVNWINADRINGGDLLSVDELKYLNKKGFVHKSDLSIKEKRDLELYNETLYQKHAEDKEIERLFKEKRLEVMLTKMFERICPDLNVNEVLLREDVSLAVLGGLYDNGSGDFTQSNEAIEKLGIKKQSIEKSRMRLSDEHFADNYVTVKK